MGAEHNVKWGFETRTGKFVMDGDRHFIQIETGLSNERRLQVFISKAMTAFARVEDEIDLMTDAEVEEYMKSLFRQCCTIESIP